MSTAVDVIRRAHYTHGRWGNEIIFAVLYVIQRSATVAEQDIWVSPSTVWNLLEEVNWAKFSIIDRFCSLVILHAHIYQWTLIAHQTLSQSAWPTLRVEIDSRKKWSWIGMLQHTAKRHSLLTMYTIQAVFLTICHANEIGWIMMMMIIIIIIITVIVIVQMSSDKRHDRSRIGVWRLYMESLNILHTKIYKRLCRIAHKDTNGAHRK